MKNTILTLAITGVIATMSLTAVAQESKKAADARKEIAEGKKELKEAKIDSAADFSKFKREAELKIADNQKKIAVLKTNRMHDNKEIKEKYDKRVLDLENRNNALERKIKTADDTKTNMWVSFKKGFDHDMNELVAAIKRI